MIHTTFLHAQHLSYSSYQGFDHYFMKDHKWLISTVYVNKTNSSTHYTACIKILASTCLTVKGDSCL